MAGPVISVTSAPLLGNTENHCLLRTMDHNTDSPDTLRD
jgi:hypothetical protein